MNRIKENLKQTEILFQLLKINRKILKFNKAKVDHFSKKYVGEKRISDMKIAASLQINGLPFFEVYHSRY